MQNTHSDEMARIAHIMNFSGAITLITATRSSMERDVLDAIHLGSDLTKLQANPYHQIVTEFFNDSNPNSEFNKSCFNPAARANGERVADEMDSRGLFSNIYDSVKDINPDNFSENIQVRDWIWMEKNMAKFTSTTGNVADKYSRSGYYECACEYLECGKFCSGSASWVMYAILIFTALEMKEWLPQLPPNQVRDTGVLGDQKKKKADSTVKDRMKRYHAKNSGEDSDVCSNEGSHNGTYDIASNFTAASEKEHELKALEVLYNGKNEKLSKKKERELAKRIKWTVERDEDDDTE